MNRIFLFLPFIFLGCVNEISHEQLLSEATGKSGRIQILMDQALWDGSMGKEIISHFDSYAEGVYLRPEKTFEFYHLSPEKFKGNLRYSKNILQIRLRNDSAYTETVINEFNNLYARNQFLIQFADSDPIRLLKTIKKEMPAVVNSFNKKEKDRLVKTMNTDYNKMIDEAAIENAGVSIHLPKTAELKMKDKGFLWVKYDRSKSQTAGHDNPFEAGTYWIQQGIIIWEVPYKDTAQLSSKGVLMNRDTTLKYRIPGKIKGSYMGTEYDIYYKPKSKITTFKEAYALKIQGLWKHLGHEAAFGGGPFVQMTIHNENRGVLTTICGYTYAPKFDKREYLRELEAMIETATLIDEK